MKHSDKFIHLWVDSNLCPLTIMSNTNANKEQDVMFLDQTKNCSIDKFRKAGIAD